MVQDKKKKYSIFFPPQTISSRSYTNKWWPGKIALKNRLTCKIPSQEEKLNSLGDKFHHFNHIQPKFSKFLGHHHYLTKRFPSFLHMMKIMILFSKNILIRIFCKNVSTATNQVYQQLIPNCSTLHCYKR